LRDEISIPNLTFSLPTSTFSKFPHKAISMISWILGYDDDLVVDEVILSIMSEMCFPFGLPLVMYHYVEFLENDIHEQWCELHELKMF